MPGAKDRTRPLFFCSDDFGQYVPWDEPAQDKNGETILNPLTDDPFTVSGLFPNIANALQGGYPVQPFWANIFNGYVFQGTTSQRMCFDTLFAATPRSRSTQNVMSGVDIQVGRFERFIYFCANGWNRRPGTTNTLAGLADIITYDNYPTGGSTAQNLGDLMPISSTFYHELFHLTDSPTAPTGDPYSTYPPYSYSYPIDSFNLLMMPELQWASKPFSEPRPKRFQATEILLSTTQSHTTISPLPRTWRGTLRKPPPAL